MRAAHSFVSSLQRDGRLEHVSRITVELYGSLALTGKGHATDRAVILGLMGEEPETIEPSSVAAHLEQVRQSHSLLLGGCHRVDFNEEHDLVFRIDATLPAHNNGMRFIAHGLRGERIASDVYYSIGGGFVMREGDVPDSVSSDNVLPHPFSSAAELLETAFRHGKSIWEIVFENECARRPASEVEDRLDRIWKTMEDCIQRGLATPGVLPGGLNVRRRAPVLLRAVSKQSASDPLTPIDWVNMVAMAVSEENASGGRIVTAPTNGAAGIIPAVGHYYLKFVPDATREGIKRYLLTAGAIGALYKENASISGAEVGCQGEVGVACSMAAGGLVAAMGGSNNQAEYAAEIGMEHNLGMTCDPVGGLVQIPCIERNAMGSVKAINAARIAMRENGEHKVSLDQVIRTMYQTGLDMQTRYKETSLAGLAVNAIEC